MITVCTVTLDDCANYYEIYKESLATKTKLVDEVLIAKTDAHSDHDIKWEKNGIKFHEFGVQPREGDGYFLQQGRLQQGLEHAIGLHNCLEKAKNNYIMFCDPDIFLYSAVDEFYYNIYNKYNLNLVGVSHCAATKFAYTFWPYLSNMFFKKSDLPPSTWLDNQIRDDYGNNKILNGKYLARMHVIQDYTSLFPNPQGDFDTGSMLWLWGYQQNWRWLSFQTLDIHNYTTKYYRGNIKITEKLPNTKLIYHATSGTAGQEENFIKFKQAWEII